MIANMSDDDFWKMKYGNKGAFSVALTEDEIKKYYDGLNKKYPKEVLKHSHYFKDVSNLDVIDVYRVIELFEVKHACIQHALKKLLVTGNRGYKDQQTDIQDVIDTLERWKAMQLEEDNK